MSKMIEEGKVVGQKVLNASTKLIEIIAPKIAAEAKPGQFVNVKVLNGTAPLLRRPLGVAAVNAIDGTITLIYRIIGETTKLLAEYCNGDRLSIVGPLGNGFAPMPKRALIVGGGVGLAPLLYLAAEAGAASVDVLMGGRTADELFWTDLYEDYVSHIYLTTDDGSLGTKGTVMALLPQLLADNDYECIYVCGPLPMMKAVAQTAAAAEIKCQVSLERYMCCGIGACLTCACAGIGKRLKVCTDGPVFWAEEVGEW